MIWILLYCHGNRSVHCHHAHSRHKALYTCVFSYYIVECQWMTCTSTSSLVKGKLPHCTWCQLCSLVVILAQNRGFVEACHSITACAFLYHCYPSLLPSLPLRSVVSGAEVSDKTEGHLQGVQLQLDQRWTVLCPGTLQWDHHHMDQGTWDIHHTTSWVWLWLAVSGSVCVCVCVCVCVSVFDT